MGWPSSQPGTYALVLAADSKHVIEVGRLGRLDVRLGFYVYVGSGRGPGGLAARVARHLRDEKKLRWHVDYLRAVTEPVEVWYAEDDMRRECRWAECVGGMRGASIAMGGFGASDCRCGAHLFFFLERPTAAGFRRRLKEAGVAQSGLP